MNKLRKILLMLGLSFLCSMLFNSCESTNTPSSAIPNRIKLNPSQSLRVMRFLHPLPQELRLSDCAYEVSANDCGLKSSSASSPEEKQAIDDFKAKWIKKRGAQLNEKDGKLNIIVGTLKNSSELQNAAKNGILDAKYLSERPNPEQAYTISTSCENGKINVYVAANAAPGLYYGLLTLGGLFDGLSKGENLVLPHSRIVDWPDIKERGILSFYTKPNIDLLKRYSGMKLNIYYYKIYPKVSPKKVISFSEKHSENHATSKKYFVKAIPVFTHTDHLFRPRLKAMINFPELAAKGKMVKDKVEETKRRTFCYAQPKTQLIIDEMFKAFIKAGTGDRLQVWLAETPNACHCGICKGNLEKQFVNEVKQFVHGYQNALRINPKLKMDLLLTQGTYPHNYAMLDYIPKDVGIDIYSGSNANNTYKSRFGEYVLTPQAEEIVARGYKTGAVPSIGTCILNDIMFPTFMPQFVKLRMSELKDRGLRRVDSWMENWRLQDLNLEALAEFSWNVDGRTSKEFIAAWATRQGMNNPDKVAETIKTLEYPIRAVTAGTRTRRMLRSVSRMVKILNGQKPYWSEWFEVLKGFEYAGKHEELARTLKQCERAAKLAKELNDKELIAASLLMRQWIAIFERYAFFLETKDADAKIKAREEVKKLSAKLPELRNHWIRFKQLDQKTLKKVTTGFDQTMKEFEKLK